MRSHLNLLFIAVLAVPAYGQTAHPAKKPASGQSTAAKHLTVDDVISMASAGLSDDVIIARLRKESTPFDLSSDDLIRLKKLKVSDAVLKVMMDPTAPAQAPAPVTPPPPQQIVIQTPTISALRGAQPSGATPAPGANETGDVNDPMTPHDSGIYLLTKGRDGKPQMVLLERAAYEGAKTGGMFGSAMTYGIKKVKTRAVIPGARANIRVTDASPVFYFYFEDKQAGLGKSSFGVQNLSNPNQFALLKLEVKKTDRETVIGQFSAFGASSGTDSKSTIQFKSEKVRTGLYKVVVDDLAEGEYCFLAQGGVIMAGPAAAYGAGATSGTDIFDFGVSRE